MNLALQQSESGSNAEIESLEPTSGGILWDIPWKANS